MISEPSYQTARCSRKTIEIDANRWTGYERTIQSAWESEIMRCRLLDIAAVAVALSAISIGIEAQETFKTPPVRNEAWIKPFPPVRIVGNVYYVGTRSTSEIWR